jgi:LCP family protein required for cell wall assembly
VSYQGETPVDDRWGTEVEGSARSRRGRRILVVVLVVLLVLTLVVPVLVSTRIPRLEVDGLASAGRGPTNVLIAGSDSREGLTDEEIVELSTGFDDGGGERTDTILLLSFDGNDTALLSFPRDLWVERCDGSVGRINVAQALGGPSCLVDTIERTSGLEVHHYTRMTFGGFRDVVDAVGGVELCLEDPIADQDAGIDLAAGCQRLDGADALGFVRVRKIDNDLARIQRQQQFMRALASEITSPSTLLNPVRLWNTANDAGGAVSVSDSLGPFGLMRVGVAARGLARGNVVTHTVPVEPDTTAGGAAVLNIRDAEAEALFARFRDGSVLDEDPSELQRSDVQLTVLNGAGVPGLAGQVAELLEGRGYQVTEVGNTEERSTTVIRHPATLRESAELVAEDLPGDVALEESGEVTNVTVTLGSDAAGLA